MTTSPQPDLRAEIETLIRDLVASYTRQHQFLSVKSLVTGNGIIVAVKADDSDQACIVGSGGKHIKALKFIVAAISRNQDIGINLTLLEAEKNGRFEQVPYAADPNWNHEPTTNLLHRVLELAMPVPYRVQKFDIDTLTNYEIATVGSYVPEGLESLIQQLHFLFHAAGKRSGREIHVSLVKPVRHDGSPL